MTNTREFYPDEYLEYLKRNNILSKAVAIAFEYGDVEGEYHKEWIIDQMVRTLSGKAYEEFRRQYQNQTGQPFPVGIAP